MGFNASFPSKAVDWTAMQALATRQGLSVIILDGIERLPECQQPPQIMLLTWIGQVMQGYEGHYVAYRKAVMELAAFYNAHGFKMMLLKGLACGRDWPNPAHRPNGDIDIWLFGKQKEADAALESHDNHNYNGHKGEVFSEVKIDRSHHQGDRGQAPVPSFISSKLHKNTPIPTEKGPSSINKQRLTIVA